MFRRMQFRALLIDKAIRKSSTHISIPISKETVTIIEIIP